MATSSGIGRPLRIYFSEIKHGDALKLLAESNTTPSGGGARDERIRPQNLAEHLRPMFPRDTEEDGVSEGTVYWMEASGSINHITIQLWRPSDARPNEGRIGRIHTIGGWLVPPEQVPDDQDHHTGWYYFLVQDHNLQVWAFVMNDQQLRNEPAWLRDFVQQRAAATPARQKVRGFIDRANNRTYP